MEIYLTFQVNIISIPRVYTPRSAKQ